MVGMLLLVGLLHARGVRTASHVHMLMQAAQ